MATNESLVNFWAYDTLLECWKATDEELDYLEQLRALRLKEKYLQTKHTNYPVPSTIIDNFLYHGTMAHAKNFNTLKKFNIQNIIHACHIRLGQNIVNKYNVLWINLKDDLNVDIRQHFDRINEFLQACRNKNERVLVNCRFGISRSSSFILAYLLRYVHDTLYNAYDYLLERRSIADPNPGFLLQLIRYEKELQADRTLLRHN